MINANVVFFDVCLFLEGEFPLQVEVNEDVLQLCFSRWRALQLCGVAANTGTRGECGGN